jgi:hypothetical protein
MKTIRLAFAAALVGCCVSGAPAQLLLSGKVTGVSGYFESAATVGDNVKLSLDFSDSAAYGDLSHGYYPHQYLYLVTATLTIGDLPVELAGTTDNLGVRLISEASATQGFPFLSEGLSIGHSWGRPDVGFTLFQQLLSRNDILSSEKAFPAGIPMDQFYSTEGQLLSYLPVPGETVFTGSIDWLVTEYSGSVRMGSPDDPDPVTPVPESSAVAWVAASMLGVYTLTRWRISRSTCSIPEFNGR